MRLLVLVPLLSVACSGEPAPSGTGGVAAVAGAAAVHGGGPGAGAGSSAVAGDGGSLPTSGAGGVAGLAGASSGGANHAGGGVAPARGGAGPGGTSASGDAGVGNNAGGRAGAGGRAAAGSGGSSAGGSSAGGSSAGGAPVACETNRVSSCTGSSPIECHFGGGTGDYQVTVELGGDAAGDAYIEAESFRRVLSQTLTAAGKTQLFSFFVNVRQPEGQPIQDVPAGTAGLDLYIRGTAPQLSSVCFEAKRPAPKLWIAGDSTVCDQDGTDYSGWGQHLPQFFAPPVSVANYADSGESSGSFLGSSKLWGAIKAGWMPGDFVLIQLGHNDKDVSGSTFQSNLTSMLTQAKSAGISAILVTPTARVGYTLAEEHVNSTGANLPQIIRDLGSSQGVPVIDLTVTTWNWLQTIDYTQYFALGTDHTHTNPKGAGVIAGFVRDAIHAQKLPLDAYLR